jgi:hypothetical protein
MVRTFFLFILGFSSITSVALAGVGWVIARPDGVINVTSPVSLTAGIITYAIGIAAVLGVIGITWWGIQMILSVGEDEKLKKWRYIVIYSVLGVVLAGLAYSIVNIVGNVKL